MRKHIIAFLCISAALSLSGIIFADFGFADCIASSVITLAVYAAAYKIRKGKTGSCSGCCSGCAYSGKCKNTENQQH